MPINNHSQTHLYFQLSAYLQQIGTAEGQVRENNLNLGGDCAGWSFLFGYYKSINKQQDFNDIKTYISKWDGQLSSLHSNTGMSEALKNKYPTGQKLFEQTINDIAWFSQVKSEKIASLSQNDRVEQYEFAANKHYELKNVFSFLREDNTNITAHDLPDMLRMTQLWKNAWLDLGIYGKNKDDKLQGHALSIYIDNNGNLHYFDSNHAKTLDTPSSPEEISTQLFKAISSWKNISLNDFSLYQLTPKDNIKNNILDDTKLDINKEVEIKFLDMALKGNHLDPIYKILSSDQKHGSELLKCYEKPLLKAAQYQEHSEMLDLLVKHNPEVLNTANQYSIDNLLKSFNSLSLSDILDFDQGDILINRQKNTVESTESTPMFFCESNILTHSTPKNLEIAFDF